MPRLRRLVRSRSLRNSIAAAIEHLEGRVLLSTYTVTNLNDAGPGSYSDALSQANNNPGADTIRFAPGLRGTLAGGGVVSDNLSIVGPGADVLTMNGDFVVPAGAAFDISGITIHGGSSAMAAISFNFASPGPTCSITDCTITGGHQFGIYAGNGNLIVTGCAVSGSQGYGIYNDGAGVTVTNSTVSGNGGAGIGGNQALLDVRDSTIANNHGPGIDSSGQGLALTNSTVANNMGGGIVSGESIGLKIANSTIVNNTGGAGIGFVSNRPATLNNTIVAGNHDANGNPSDLSGTVIPPLGGSFIGSNNLIGTAGAGGLVNGQNGNIVGIADPKLAPLGDHGGPTQTMPPLAGSPAIDAGSNALAVGPDGHALLDDQRGNVRIANGTVDIGAVEFDSTPLVFNGTVTNLNDSGPGSLRDAIEEANIHPGDDTITFDPGLSGTITLTSGALIITDDVSIIGPGANVLAVSGNHASGAFDVEDLAEGTINISGITVKDSGGSASAPPAVGNEIPGDLVLTDCVLSGNSGYVVAWGDGLASITRCTISGNTGGIVVNASKLIVRGSTISGNAGGILTRQVEMSDTVISDNAGAAIDIGGFPADSTITGCTVNGNDGDGVDFNSAATMTVTNCTIANNSGIGIWERGNKVTVNGSTISGNASGIEAQGPTVVVNSTIANNRPTNANRQGGGIVTNSVLSVVNSTISGNVASQGAGIWLADIPGSATTSATIDNTIVAANHDLNGGTSDLFASTNASPPATFSGSNNLIGTGGSGGLVNGRNGNIVGIADPKLAPLGDHGGPTQTMPPLAGSPAIDAGNNAMAVDSNGKPLISDQRGYYRIANGTVDIGAVEFNSMPVVPGDANGDGKVDFNDLLIIARNYGTQNGASWSEGDFTGDGAVNFDDLLIIARNYGQTRLRR